MRSTYVVFRVSRYLGHQNQNEITDLLRNGINQNIMKIVKAAQL